jgi:hypothetical protein
VLGEFDEAESIHVAKKQRHTSERLDRLGELRLLSRMDRITGSAGLTGSDDESDVACYTTAFAEHNLFILSI